MPLADWFRAGCVYTRDKIVVEGAGGPGVDGVYLRSGQKCDGADVFRKKGTPFAIMRHGNLGWSIADVGGRGNDRWTLYTVEMYFAASNPAGSAPPLVGWTTVDGAAPAPLLRKAKTSLPYLHDSGDDQLLRKTQKLRALSTSDFLRIGNARKPLKNAKEEANQTYMLSGTNLPHPISERLLDRESCEEWGLRDSLCTPPAGVKHIKVKRMPSISRSESEPRLPRRPMSRAALQASMAALSLDALEPDTTIPPHLVRRPGENVDLVHSFNVLLWRPTCLMPWGFSWSDSIFKSKGARVIASVDKWSPLQRWNEWQKLRGRPELCVKPSDRLIRVDGMWAFSETEVGRYDGDLGNTALECLTSGAEDHTGGCIVLEFARPAVRPCAPPPPEAQPLEREAVIRISWTSIAEGVLGWALCLKELTTNTWLAVSGQSMIAAPINPGDEIASFRHEQVIMFSELDDYEQNEGTQCSVSIWRGLACGRPYAACIALLTDHGWSTFSELSRATYLSPSANTDALLNLYRLDPNPPKDDVMPDRPYMTLPPQILPGASTPIALVGNVREFCGERRFLRIQATFTGNIQGLHVRTNADGAGRSIVVTRIEEGSTMDKWFHEAEQHHALTLHGMRIVPALRPGDAIVRVNGVCGAVQMVAELKRLPSVLALRFERLCGGIEADELDHLEMSSVPSFRIDARLDHHTSRIVEEISSNNLMEQEEGALIYGMLENDTETLEELIHTAATAAQWSETSKYARLLQDASKRLVLIRRQRELDIYADAHDAEGELDTDELEDRVIMGLRTSFVDISCDPENLATAINQFENTSQAVQMSKEGQKLKERALALQGLWRWRQNANRNHLALLATLQESLGMEFRSLVEDQASSTSEEAGDEEEKLDTERLTETIEEARLYTKHSQVEFDILEAEQVLIRHKEINKRYKAEMKLDDTMQNPRADESALLEAVQEAEDTGVDFGKLEQARAALLTKNETSERAEAQDELFKAIRELRVLVEDRIEPGIGAEEQRRVRTALVKAALPSDNELVQEAAVLLRRWEADNMALRVEARLLNAVRRAKEGYKPSEPKAGDLLGCAIAEVAQQGVAPDLLEDAREVLDTWFESRKARAVKDINIAREYKDENFLKEAIQLGEEAGVDEKFLEESKFDLQRLQWEEEVNKMLDAAMETTEMEPLLLAVQRAHQGYFTEDDNVRLRAGALQVNLRFWAESFRQVQQSKNAEGLDVDVRTAYDLLKKAETAKQDMLKNDQSNNKNKELTPEVVYRTLDRDVRSLELQMPRTRDMAAVFVAEQAILRVLGAVEKYAADLPAVIEAANKQVPRGLNRQYVTDAKKCLQEYNKTVSELTGAIAAGVEIPGMTLKSALIKARLAGAPQDLVEQGTQLLDNRDPDLWAYAQIELELLLAKAEADDIAEVSVESRFLRLQDAADEAKRLQPPMDEEVLDEVHDYSMALAAEKALVEQLEEGEALLSGTKTASPEEVEQCFRKMSQVARSADADALDEVKKIIPKAEEAGNELQKVYKSRLAALNRAEKLCEQKGVPVIELREALIAAKGAFLPTTLLNDAYTRLQRRKLEQLPTDLMAAVKSGARASAAGLWQRGLLYKASDSFSDWWRTADSYQSMAARSSNLLSVQGNMDGKGGPFGSSRWRNNPYWIIRKISDAPDGKKKKKQRGGGSAGNSARNHGPTKVTICVAEAADKPANLAIHAVRNRHKIAAAAAAAKCPTLLAPGPEVLAKPSDDKGIPTCSLELPPPDDDWPVFIVPSAAIGEAGPFNIFVDATAPVELVLVEDAQRFPWKFEQTHEIKWIDQPPWAKSMGGGRCGQKAAAMPWYRNPQFRVQLLDSSDDSKSSKERPQSAARVSLSHLDYKRAAKENLPQPLKVHIAKARGLRNADYLHGQGTSDPYCVCMIEHKTWTAIETHVIDEEENPEWNFDGHLTEYTIGESINFAVYDKDEGKEDDLLGRLEIPGKDIFPNGVKGEFKLKEAGRSIKGEEIQAFLTIDIRFEVGSEIATTTASAGPAITLVPPEEAANPTPTIMVVPPAEDAPIMPSVDEELPDDIETQLRDIFTRCDRHGDGNIEKIELLRVCKTSEDVLKFFGLENSSRSHLEKLFKELDVNDDKEISWDEFRSFYVEHLWRPPQQHAVAVIPAATEQLGATAPHAAEHADEWVTDPVIEDQLRRIFIACDLKQNGVLDKRELIKKVRSEAEIAEFFGLPRLIREGESRDAMETLFQKLDENDNRVIEWDEFHRFYTNQVVQQKNVEKMGIMEAPRQTSPPDETSRAGTLSLPSSAGSKREKPKRPSRSPRRGSKRAADVEEKVVKTTAPMLLVIMEPHRGEPESAYSMHIVQNRAGTTQYTEDRVVENLRGHTLVSCTVPNKKKLRDEYQRVPEAGAACNLFRDAETGAGDILFVVPSLETTTNTGLFTLRFLATEKISVDLVK